MIVGLLAALAAAVAYGVASVLQAVGSRRLATAAPDARLLLRLLRSAPYVAGPRPRRRRLRRHRRRPAGAAAVRRRVRHRVERRRHRARRVPLARVRGCGGPSASRSSCSGSASSLLAVERRGRGRPAPLARPAAGSCSRCPLLVAAAAGRRRPGARRPGGAPCSRRPPGLGFAGVGIAARALQPPTPWWAAPRRPAAVGAGARRRDRPRRLRRGPPARRRHRGRRGDLRGRDGRAGGRRVPRRSATGPGPGFLPVAVAGPARSPSAPRSPSPGTASPRGTPAVQSRLTPAPSEIRVPLPDAVLDLPAGREPCVLTTLLSADGSPHATEVCGRTSTATRSSSTASTPIRKVRQRPAGPPGRPSW